MASFCLLYLSSLKLSATLFAKLAQQGPQGDQGPQDGASYGSTFVLGTNSKHMWQEVFGRGSTIPLREKHAG